MSIILHCDLCETDVENVENVILAIQHWMILRYKVTDKLPATEQHFCPKCAIEQLEDTEKKDG